VSQIVFEDFNTSKSVMGVEFIYWVVYYSVAQSYYLSRNGCVFLSYRASFKWC